MGINGSLGSAFVSASDLVLEGLRLGALDAPPTPLDDLRRRLSGATYVLVGGGLGDDVDVALASAISDRLLGPALVVDPEV